MAHVRQVRGAQGATMEQLSPEAPGAASQSNTMPLDLPPAGAEFIVTLDAPNTSPGIMLGGDDNAGLLIQGRDRRITHVNGCHVKSMAELRAAAAGQPVLRIHLSPLERPEDGGGADADGIFPVDTEVTVQGLNPDGKFAHLNGLTGVDGKAAMKVAIEHGGQEILQTLMPDNVSLVVFPGLNPDGKFAHLNGLTGVVRGRKELKDGKAAMKVAIEHGGQEILQTLMPANVTRVADPMAGTFIGGKVAGGDVPAGEFDYKEMLKELPEDSKLRMLDEDVVDDGPATLRIKRDKVGDDWGLTWQGGTLILEEITPESPYWTGEPKESDIKACLGKRLVY
eukprot:gene26281-45273_t